MKFILSIVFLPFSSLLFAQHQEFNWLIGTWQEGQKKSFETWEVKDNFLFATAYIVDRSGNKIITEEIKLIKKEKDFFYVPDVAGPQGAIEFRITSFGETSFVAENPEHDFPKKIVYKKINEGELVATISAGSNSTSYSFRKIR